MAHSYISVNSLDTERTICVTDAILQLFMYFFIQQLQRIELSEKEKAIYSYYKLELDQPHTSFIDLKLDEVSIDADLKQWYLLILKKVRLSLNSFNEFLDNNYINSLKGLNKQFNKPVRVEKITNLVQDLMWLLKSGEYSPSGEYKWFEKPIQDY